VHWFHSFLICKCLFLAKTSLAFGQLLSLDRSDICKRNKAFIGTDLIAFIFYFHSIYGIYYIHPLHNWFVTVNFKADLYPIGKNIPTVEFLDFSIYDK